MKAGYDDDHRFDTWSLKNESVVILIRPIAAL